MARTFLALTIVVLYAAPLPAWTQTLEAEQQRFREIYRELVEIDTTDSAGDNTKAARAMQKRLRDAGFAAHDAQVFEPFPKKGNLVARLKGAGSKKPLLLVAHLDVVEAKREDWNSDPFKLQEQDGYFTARGALDDKAMASAFVSILAQLRREGFRPIRDIVLALTADEEQGDVPSNGVHWLVNHKPELLRAEIGINEGGVGELRNGRPTVQRVQVAEKMYASYELEVTNPGGHSSLPRADNAIYELAAALVRVGQHRFPAKTAEVTRTYFERSAAFASGQLAADMRAVAGENPDPEAAERLSKLPQYNAQLRTTCVATMLSAGHAENALPQSARAVVNCRILPHDDPAEVERELRRVVGEQVQVTPGKKGVRSPSSPLDPAILASIEVLTEEMWPDAMVVPTMGTGATDSRFLRNAGIAMYGVSGIFLDPADMRAHGRDERVEVARLYEGREFLYRLVKRLAQ